jgi:hypothetical protein
VTILRRYQSQTSRHESVSLAAKARRWLSTHFGRAPPTTLKSGNANDNEALANALDDSAAAVNDNAQDITVVRRRQVSSPSSTPTPSPSVSAVPSASAAPIAQDPPAAAAAAAPKPALNAADAADDDDNNSNNDALVNTPDGSSADVSKNLQNITVLRSRRYKKRQSGIDDDGDNDDGDDGNDNDMEDDTEDDTDGDDDDGAEFTPFRS